MNWETIEGKWDQFKGRVKQQWGKLTDNDLKVIGGKKDELAGKLQEKYGYAKDRAEKVIKNFCRKCEREIQEDRSSSRQEKDFHESSVN